MSLDARTPVIVGVGQVVHRDGDAPEPTDLLAEAARRAGEDCGARLLPAVQSVRVVRIVSRSYPDPARLVADRLGLAEVETVYTGGGGQSPLELLAGAMEEIRRGALDAVLLGGAESWRTRRRYKRRGESSGWTTQPDDIRPDRMIGAELEMTSPAESRIGFRDPVHAYPLFEVALRARLGRAPDEHLRTIGELWSGFSRVAARNPYAALRAPMSRDEIVAVGPANRLVCTPYRKLMVANDDVDQAAALLVCSVGMAQEHGIPRDRWVFLHGYGRADDTAFVSTRDDLSRSPAIRHAGTVAFAGAGVGHDDIAHLDLYSCFPSAVQIAAEELGFGLDRQLTVTGGLTFAGGPWHDYVSHSVAAMVGRLREEPDSLGLCSANGGLLTKHAVAILAARPGGGPIDTTSSYRPPDRPSAPDHRGPAVVEASTVVYARDGVAERAFVACRTSQGHRVLAGAVEPSVLASFAAGDRVGEQVQVAGGWVVA